MCKIKEGAAVQSKGDLQNLVTSVILRQTSTFSSEDIYQVAKTKLVGSGNNKNGSPERGAVSAAD